MWMFCTCIDFELGHLLTAKWAFGQHAFDRQTNCFCRLTTQQLRIAFALETTWVAAVAIEHLFVGFTRSKNYLVDVDDDDVIASVDVWSESCFVLSAQ